VTPDKDERKTLAKIELQLARLGRPSQAPFTR